MNKIWLPVCVLLLSIACFIKLWNVNQDISYNKGIYAYKDQLHEKLLECTAVHDTSCHIAEADNLEFYATPD